MNTTSQEYQDFLSLKPCVPSVRFAEGFDSLYDAWESCIKPTWMWWYLLKTEHPDVLWSMQQKVFEYMLKQTKDIPSIHATIIGYRNINSPSSWNTIMATAHITDHRDGVLAPELCKYIRTLTPNPFQKYEHI